jgi:DNA-directed RNA polymerase sigma subunit (sigma70/sigma32)
LIGRGGDSVGTLLADDEPDPFEEVGTRMLIEAVRVAVDGLPHGERQVIEARHGLDGSVPLTLTETRRQFGLGRNEASRLEAQALRHLSREPVLLALHEAA